MESIVYFTAGPQTTNDEKADIAKLNAAAAPAYSVTVANSQVKAIYGETNRLIPCELVAGTIPTIYNAKPVINPDAIPARGLSDTQAVVNDGDDFAVTGGTITVSVEEGVATFTYTATP